MMTNEKPNPYRSVVIAGSVVIPLLVALLFFMPKQDWFGENVHVLPGINAIINSLTAITLVAGFFAIKSGNIPLHRKLMTSAIVLSALFLVFYVLYHATSESTKYGGEGAMKVVYYVILISHIILAAAIVPLVLITYVRALSERFDKHRKIARITLPLWLYVSITGVLVYLLISPYYGT